MQLTTIALVLCACLCLVVGDVAPLKSAKTKLLGKIVRAKHHKRGVLSPIPPYKLGYDIPVVTHSLVKPLVVSYPPAAAVAAVKVPLHNPFPHYPVPVGHRVPVPHPHYGLKFPHHSKTVLVPQPENHFHHHHHHVEPKPVIPVAPELHVPAPVPVPATPVAPIGQPTATVHAHPGNSPPLLIQPQPIPAPAPAFPVPGFAPATHLVPQPQVHLRPVVPAQAPVVPAPAPFTPLLPIQSQFPYLLRAGNALQTSFYANYPRYPFLNYQSPFYPFVQAAAPQVNQVLLGQSHAPHLQHHLHLVPQAGHQEGVVIEQPGHVPVEPTTLLHHAQADIPHLHLQPTQPTLHLQPTQPAVHFQPTQPAVHLQPDVHLQQEIPLQPGQPEVHFQSGQPEVHFHSAQPGVLQPTQPTAHVQPTVHVHPTQPAIHQVPLEHNGWSPVQPTPHDIAVSQGGAHGGHDASFGTGTQFAHDGQFGQGNQFDQGSYFAQAGAGQFSHDGNFAQEGNFGQTGHHQFTQEHGTQVYEHHTGDEQNSYQNELQHHIQQQLDQAQFEQHFNNQQHRQAGVPHDSYGVPILNQDYGQPNHDFGHNGQNFGQDQDFRQYSNNFGQGQDISQHGQNFGQSDFNQHQPAAEYGVPQSAEGRSSEGHEEYHDHIPLKFQPPLEKTLDHFKR